MKKHLTTTLLFLLLPLTPLSAFAADDPELAVNLRLEVWQAPQLTAIEILDEARGLADAAGLTVGLRAAAREAETDITLIALPSITARSGQRAKVDSGSNRYVSGYKIDTKSGQEVPVTSDYITGTSFEVDPVIGEDGVTMEINLAFDHALEEPVLKERTISGPASGKDLVIQEVEENRADLSTAVTMISGQTRLLGSIPAKEGNLLLIFLYAEVLQVNP